MKKIVVIIGIVVGIAFILSLVGFAIFLIHQKTTPLVSAPSHGTSFTIEADLSKAQGDPKIMANLEAMLRGRFSKLGLNVFLESISDSKIRIVAPITEAKQVDTVSHAVFEGGYLEIRLVQEDSEQLIKNGKVPPDYEVLNDDVRQRNGSVQTERLVVKKEPEHGLAGAIIKEAFVADDGQGAWMVFITLNQEKTAALAKVTRDDLHRQLAIVVNGKVYSAPVIEGVFDSGKCQISGHFDQREATALADLLNNPLPVPFSILEVKTF